MEHKPFIINSGSVHDIKNTLHHYHDVSAEQIEAEIETEKQWQNRKTVITLLKARLKKARKKELETITKTSRL